MAASVSDVAAMGARPRIATVALGMRREMTTVEALELYRGMLGASDDARIVISGGDVSRAPVLSIVVTLVGEARPSNLKTRDGAKPGDCIAVTGPLGAARAGWMCGGSYALPPVRWREGLWLGASRHVHAMMDLSDGLSTDLTRLCAASKCAAVVDHIPVAAQARSYAASSGDEAVAFALAGGEDFELLVAVEHRAFGYLARRFAARFGRALECVGSIVRGTGLSLRMNGDTVALTASGWDHFSA